MIFGILTVLMVAIYKWIIIVLLFSFKRGKRMNILIVEDNPRVSELLKRGLESKGYRIYISEDAEDAVPIIEKIPLDLMITDVMLPKMDGITLVKKLRSEGNPIPIIMLTALGNVDEKIGGFEAGADDYLVKPFEIRELYARINALIQRSSATKKPNTEIAYSDLLINDSSKTVKRNGQAIDLTPKEFRLLYYMMSNPEVVLSKEEIAENVWGNNFDTGTNYIDVLSRIYGRKLIKISNINSFIPNREWDLS